VLRIEALRAAVAEARSGSDLKSYEDALQLLRRSLRASEMEVQADSAWMEKKDKQNKAETARLEHELKGYKNNLIKESIRVSLPHQNPLSLRLSRLLTIVTLSDGQRGPWQPLLQYWRSQ
jgi:26S proteasome subunit RPN7